MFAIRFAAGQWRVEQMSVVVEQLEESRHAIQDVLRSRPLRRLNLALVGSVIGDWAFAVAFSVYAYNNGGATALGVISVVRYVTMAVLAPFVATLADRFDRRLVMVTADLLRVVLVLAAAMVLFVDGPVLAVYALSIVVGIVGLVFAFLLLRSDRRHGGLLERAEHKAE